MSDRELVQMCANQLELTTTPLPYDFQVELLRRFNALLLWQGDRVVPDESDDNTEP